MKRQSYRGIFKIIPDQRAEFVQGLQQSDSFSEMTCEYQIRCISEALRTASTEYFTQSEMMAGGWCPHVTPSSTLQAVLQGAEASGEATFHKDQLEFSSNLAAMTEIVCSHL